MAMLSLVLTQLVPECWKELICVGFQVTLETLPWAKHLYSLEVQPHS